MNFEIIWAIGSVVAVLLWFFTTKLKFTDDEGWITITTYTILIMFSWIAVVIGLASLL